VALSSGNFPSSPDRKNNDDEFSAHPVATLPNAPTVGGPQGIILSGPYLSDAKLIAVGYALEQALQGRVESDLDATIAAIDAVTGK